MLMIKIITKRIIIRTRKKEYVKITVTIDWKTQFIQTVNLNVDQKITEI